MGNNYEEQEIMRRWILPEGERDIKLSPEQCMDRIEAGARALTVNKLIKIRNAKRAKAAKTTTINGKEYYMLQRPKQCQ